MSSTITPKPSAGQPQTSDRTDLVPLTQQIGGLIRTPLELAERIRAAQKHAHILTPALSVAAIPPHIAISPIPVVVDPTFDPVTGRGNDVYFQRSIHKSEKRGENWVPLEVSLNANAIKRFLSGAGVNVTRSRRTDDGKTPNYWAWESLGKIRDFDGSWRDLPPGNVEIDLREGSAQVGEWTPEEWAKHEADAERRRQALPEKERWKVKTEPIGGWTGDRVLAARRFGLRLAEAKSLNALGRNLGLKQIYSIEELKKPFWIFRATYMPDMSDPLTRQMVTAAELGATNLLYPGSSPAPAALPGAAGATPAALPEVTETTTDAGTSAQVSAPAEGGERPFEDDEADGDAEKAVDVIFVTEAPGGIYRVTIRTLNGDQTLQTSDRELARACVRAKKDGRQVIPDIAREGEILGLLAITLGPKADKL